MGVLFGRTYRKWAPFQARQKSYPSRLQDGFCFFRYPLPSESSSFLTVGLPPPQRVRVAGLVGFSQPVCSMDHIGKGGQRLCPGGTCGYRRLRLTKAIRRDRASFWLQRVSLLRCLLFTRLLSGRFTLRLAFLPVPVCRPRAPEAVRRQILVLGASHGWLPFRTSE